MRRLYSIFAAVLLTAGVFAQSPGKMSYQAVIRNTSNALVTNAQIGMQISILQGSVNGTAVYTETQTATTNANGLVSIEIGGGEGFNSIDWSAGPYFIETKTAIVAPFTDYTITGTSQLLSVPYALHAKTAETITGTVTETDPLFMEWDKDYNDLVNKPAIANSQWISGGSNIYYNSGFVGIGNTDPRNNLHITTSGNGNDSRTFALRLENDDFGSTATGIAFSVEGGEYNYAKSAIVFERTDTHARGKMHFLMSNEMNTNDVTFTESALTIDKNKYIGVGTSTPASKLTVSGGDIYISDSDKGIIMKSSNGSCWIVTVNNFGEIQCAPTNCL